MGKKLSADDVNGAACRLIASGHGVYKAYIADVRGLLAPDMSMKEFGKLLIEMRRKGEVVLSDDRDLREQYNDDSFAAKLLRTGEIRETGPNGIQSFYFVTPPLKCFRSQPSSRKTDVLDPMIRELVEVVRDSLAVEDEELRRRVAMRLEGCLREMCSTVVATVSRLKRMREEETRPRGVDLYARDGSRKIRYEALRRTEHQVVCAGGVRFDLKSGNEIGGVGYDRCYLTEDSLAVARAMPVGHTDVSRAHDKLYGKLYK